MPHPFEYEAPSEDGTRRIQEVRTALKQAYEQILKSVPRCAERTTAIRKLEECSMWANKAVAFNGENYLE